MTRALLSLALVACAAPPAPAAPPTGIPVDPSPHTGFPAPGFAPPAAGPARLRAPSSAAVVPRPPDDPPDPEDCLPVPVEHAGRDTWHNWCADSVLGNQATDCDRPITDAGCDVLVRGRRYDGIRGSVLYEVKTGAWSRFTRHVRLLKLWEYRDEAIDDLERAMSCGFGYFFAVADAELASALDKSVGIPGLFIHVPQCSRNLRP